MLSCMFARVNESRYCKRTQGLWRVQPQAPAVLHSLVSENWKGQTVKGVLANSFTIIPDSCLWRFSFACMWEMNSKIYIFFSLCFYVFFLLLSLSNLNTGSPGFYVADFIQACSLRVQGFTRNRKTKPQNIPNSFWETALWPVGPELGEGVSHHTEWLQCMRSELVGGHRNFHILLLFH